MVSLGVYRVKTIETKSILWNLESSCGPGALSEDSPRRNKGHALVEFTLAFILLLIVAWIPADFGLAFYTGQLAQNASREGARIAAADTALVNASCTMPCSSAVAGTPLKAAADRLSSALLPGATINIALDPPAGALCNRLVTVTITGPYNFFFYSVLRLMGGNVQNPVLITRQTSMRWEHQC